MICRVPTHTSPSSLIITVKQIKTLGNWKRFCELIEINPLVHLLADDWDFELTLEQAVDCEILPPHYLSDFYSKLLELRKK